MVQTIGLILGSVCSQSSVFLLGPVDRINLPFFLDFFERKKVFFICFICVVKIKNMNLNLA